MSLLADTEIGTLGEAHDAEYRSWATCDQVIAHFSKGQTILMRCRLVQ